MPRLPKEVLGRFSKKTSNINNKFQKYRLKNRFLIYSFVAIIGVELSSLFLVNLDNYLLFIYPILTQLVMFIAILTLALYSRRLNFCSRKEISLYLVSLYYLFNMISVTFSLTNYNYSLVVNVVIMTTSLILLFTEVDKK